jgi:hypothetical protein
MNGTSYTLVGILPPNFSLPIPDAELLVPLGPDADPWRFDRNTIKSRHRGAKCAEQPDPPCTSGSQPPTNC